MERTWNRVQNWWDRSPLALPLLFSFAALLWGVFCLVMPGAAHAQISEAASTTLEWVRQATAFVAIAIVFYWITYGVLFGLRGVWQEGFQQMSSTWKPAMFITAGAIIGLPALLGWANSNVSGFTAK